MNRIPLAVLATLLLLCSCNSQTADHTPDTTDNEVHYLYPTNPDTLLTPEEWAFYESIFNTQWMKEYMTYIKNNFKLYNKIINPNCCYTESNNEVHKRYDWDYWTLVYIDDNDTPELCFEHPYCTAESEVLFTNHKGKVDHIAYNGYLFILPHSGLCNSSDGHMGVDWEIYHRIHEGTITPFMEYEFTDCHHAPVTDTYIHVSFVVYDGDTIYKQYDKGEHCDTRNRIKQHIDSSNTVAYYDTTGTSAQYNTYRYYPMAVIDKYLEEI